MAFASEVRTPSQSLGSMESDPSMTTTRSRMVWLTHRQHSGRPTQMFSQSFVGARVGGIVGGTLGGLLG